MNNEIKTQLQQREFAVLKGQRRTLLKWATGCGKSKMAIDLINHTVEQSRLVTKPIKALFVVAERAHIKNWQLEFEKWNLSERVHTTIICYNSLKKHVDAHYDILVMDECHHAFSEKRLEVLKEIGQHSFSFWNIILLSATLSRNKQDTIEDIFGKFTTSTVTLKDAIQSDILPDPKVYVVALELNDEDIDQELRVNKADDDSPVVSLEQRNKYLFKNRPCIIKCTEKQKYIYYTTTMEYWKQRYERSKNQFHHNLWVNMGSVRKRFLGELKTKVVRTLLGQMPANKRYVCFCASVAQAENLCAKDTISSKKSSKRNQAIIDAFNSRKTNQIYAVGMITEGMNLTDIQVGIIVQLDGKERLFIQKFGRSMRAEDPVSFIFYYKDTQDENYLKNALENIDSKYVQHISINQLKAIKL